MKKIILIVLFFVVCVYAKNTPVVVNEFGDIANPANFIERNINPLIVDATNAVLGEINPQIEALEDADYDNYYKFVFGTNAIWFAVNENSTDITALQANIIALNGQTNLLWSTIGDNEVNRIAGTNSLWSAINALSGQTVNGTNALWIALNEYRADDAAGTNALWEALGEYGSAAEAGTNALRIVIDENYAEYVAGTNELTELVNNLSDDVAGVVFDYDNYVLESSNNVFTATNAYDGFAGYRVVSGVDTNIQSIDFGPPVVTNFVYVTNYTYYSFAEDVDVQSNDADIAVLQTGKVDIADFQNGTNVLQEAINAKVGTNDFVQATNQIELVKADKSYVDEATDGVAKVTEDNVFVTQTFLDSIKSGTPSTALTNSVCWGSFSTAKLWSFLWGNYTVATNKSFAVGSHSTAYNSGIALGDYTEANNSVAIGYQAQAPDAREIQIGNFNYTSHVDLEAHDDVNVTAFFGDIKLLTSMGGIFSWNGAKVATEEDIDDAVANTAKVNQENVFTTNQVMQGGLSVGDFISMYYDSNDLIIKNANSIGDVFMDARRLGVGISPDRIAHFYDNSSSTATMLLVEQAGTGDSGIAVKTPDIAWTQGIDSSGDTSLRWSATSGDIGSNLKMLLDTSGNLSVFGRGTFIDGGIISQEGGTVEPALLIGADVNSNTLTDNARKTGIIKARSYVNGRDAEIFSFDSISSADNYLNFGGRVNSSTYSATKMYFNTQANSSTVGAINAMTIDNHQNVTIPNGNLNVTQNIQAGGYKSSDGTAGASGTIDLSTVTSITVKNGLIVGWE